jgi:putative salt-induced outer membrane protein YdiY
MQQSTLKHLPAAVAACALAGGLPVACAQSGGAAEEKAPAWEITAMMGASVTSGNSETVLFTANLLAEKKWARDEVRIGIDAGYGESEGDKNNDYLKGAIQYNHLFSERLYGYVRVDGLHDDIASVMYRLTVGPGVGYYFVKNDKITLSGEFGPGFVTERDAEGGGVYSTDNYVTLRFAERFEYKFSSKAKLWQSVEFLPDVEDWGNYIVNAEIGIESPLTQKLSLRAYAQDTYDSQPAAGRENNDLKLVAGLAYKIK